MGDLIDAVQVTTFSTRGWIAETPEARKERVTRAVAELVYGLRFDQTALVEAHDPGERNDGRMFTVTIRPWP